MRLVTLALAFAVVLTSCGIPVDDDPVSVALPEDFELEPSTTTTTTIPQEIPANSRIIVLIREGQLVRRFREIAEPITTAKVIDALVAGPTDEEGDTGHETLVPADMSIETSIEGGVLVLNLRGEFTEEFMSRGNA